MMFTTFFNKWNRSLLMRIDLPSGWLTQLVGTGTSFWVGAAVSLMERRASRSGLLHWLTSMEYSGLGGLVCDVLTVGLRSPL